MPDIYSPTSQEVDRVDSKSIAYQSMEGEWHLYHSLLGGTPVMRAGEKEWLPQEPDETADHYKVRLQRSFLSNYFKDTIDRLVSKPFSRSVKLVEGDKLSDMLQLIEQDCDAAGTTLTMFGRELMESACTYGLTYILVDYPQMSPEATRQDEIDNKAYPRFIHIKPPQLLEPTFVQLDNGLSVLDSIRYQETRIEKKGEYLQQEVDYIRIYSRAGWELWRKDPDKDGDDEEAWVKKAEGTHTYPGGVPLVAYYVRKTGNMTGESPLKSLAWVNLAHYQTSSDYRNGVRHTTHGILFMSGVSKADMEKRVSVGPSALMRTSAEGADMKYVEHTGQGIAAARNYLSDLEDHMEQLGMQPLVSRSGDATATGRAIDEARSYTDIQAWVETLESVLLDCYKVAARWIGEELPEEFRVDINSDFGISLKDAKDLQALMSARASADIDQETFLLELQRRGVLHELLDITNIQEKVEQEGPNLDELTGLQPGQENEE